MMFNNTAAGPNDDDVKALVDVGGASNGGGENDIECNEENNEREGEEDMTQQEDTGTSTCTSNNTGTSNTSTCTDRTNAITSTTTTCTKSSPTTKTITKSSNKCPKCNKRLCNDGCIHKLCYNCCCTTMQIDSNENGVSSSAHSLSQEQQLERCEVHFKQYSMNQWKEQVIHGTTPIQIRAQQLRNLQLLRNRSTTTTRTTTQQQLLNSKSKKSFFYESNFVYQGDTVVIWNIYDYYHRIYKQDDRQNTVSSSSFVTTTTTTTTTATTTIPSNRRYHRNTTPSSSFLQKKQSNDTIRRLRINRKRFHRIMNELYIQNNTM